jgi:hypothetical protein
MREQLTEQLFIVELKYEGRGQDGEQDSVLGSHLKGNRQSHELLTDVALLVFFMAEQFTVHIDWLL